MSTLLPFILSLIASVYADTREQSAYLWIKSISDSSFQDYEGIYQRNDTVYDCFSASATKSPPYDSTFVHTKPLPTPAYLYVDGTMVFENGTLYMGSGNAFYLRLVLTDSEPCADIDGSADYVLMRTVYYTQSNLLGLQDGLWHDPSSSTTNVAFCASDGDDVVDATECNTDAPTSTPTTEPTLDPTMEPTQEPTLEPTPLPTPTPTAPRVKYYFCKDFATPTCTSCDPFTFRICLFITTDPMGDSIAKISIIGPNDRSFMVYFTLIELNIHGVNAADAAADQWLAVFKDSAFGYVVNPTENTAGEIHISNVTFDYSNYTRYQQNSIITEYDDAYTADSVLVRFERPVFTNDTTDWQFGFDQLLDPFYICFMIQDKDKSDFAVTVDKDCTESINPLSDSNAFPVADDEQIEGNYGLRTSFEFDDFNIFFGYDPFEGQYYGQCIKPKDLWIIWGEYYETNATEALKDNTQWQYATFCDVHSKVNDTLTGFASLYHQWSPSYEGGPSLIGDADQIWDIGVDDLGDGMHRINFSVSNADMDNIATGWDTSRFLATRVLDFNVFYGSGSAAMAKDFTDQNEIFYGSVSVFLDYVTAAPTLAPTAAPSLAPTLAPSNAPSMAPSLAPSNAPSLAPSNAPSVAPSNAPSNAPSLAPSNAPSLTPSNAPSSPPTSAPSSAPSAAPSFAPTPEAYFCFMFCWPQDITLDTSLMESTVLDALNAQTSLNDFGGITCTDIASDSAIFDMTIDNALCSQCCVSIVGFTERERYTLLKDVNDNILLFSNALGTALAEDRSFLEAITYGEADEVVIDNDCDGIPYPRVCREALAVDGYQFSVGFNTQNDTVKFQLCYGNGDAFFGVGFGDTGMDGNGVVYTTGLDDTDAAGVYDYTFTETSIAGVTKVGDVITFESQSIDGVFCVEFMKDATDIDVAWSDTDAMVSIWYAVGSTLQLANHGAANRDYSSFPLVPSSESISTQWCGATVVDRCTVIPEDTTTTKDPSNDTALCGEDGTKGGQEVTVGDFIVVAIIDCTTETILLNITYTKYNDNWFGCVFSDSMMGDALVYTTGKSSEDTRDAALYAYINTGRGGDGSGVTYQSSKDWREYSVMRRRLADGDELNIIYEQDLSVVYGGITAETDTVGIRFVVGDTLELDFHSQIGAFAEIDLKSGFVVTTEDDETLKYVHGGIMFTAWTIMCSVGIISSAFRYIYGKNNDARWFLVHKVTSIAVIVLDLIAFAIAIYFTVDSGAPHFAGLHQQLGLVVTIIAVFQPLNALIRPLPVESGQDKPKPRLIWEIVHKLCGYGGWILSQVVIYLGVSIVSNDGEPWKVVVLVCSVLVVVVYFVLWGVQCTKGDEPVTSSEQGSPSLDKVTSAEPQESLELGLNASTPAAGDGTPAGKDDTTVEKDEKDEQQQDEQIQKKETKADDKDSSSSSDDDSFAFKA